MEGWFTRQARRAWQGRNYLKDPEAILGTAKMQTLRAEASQLGRDDVQVLWLKAAYEEFCISFAQQLSLSGQVSMRFEKETKEISSQPTSLLNDALPDSSRLRQGCPLRQSPDQGWGFLHASLLDYFFTTAIASSLQSPPHTHTRRSSKPSPRQVGQPLPCWRRLT